MKFVLDPVTTPRPDFKGFCISGFKDVVLESDYCYQMYPVISYWTEAELSCREKGGSLASIHSDEDIESILFEWGSSIGESGLWIGLSSYGKIVRTMSLIAWSMR